MLLKNFLEILSNYKSHIIKIIFFEIFYVMMGYKGNQFNFSKNPRMTSNIPCPYYFLRKIEKKLKENNFNVFVDLGCGSGRAIDFFNKKFENKKFIGIDFFEEYCNLCKTIFKKNKNVKIIQSDFTKLNLSDFDADCFFFNDPILNQSESIDFVKKIVKSKESNKSILLIFVNCNKNLFNSFDQINCVDSYYINNIKGYSIYRLD